MDDEFDGIFPMRSRAITGATVSDVSPEVLRSVAVDLERDLGEPADFILVAVPRGTGHGVDVSVFSPRA